MKPAGAAKLQPGPVAVQICPTDPERLRWVIQDTELEIARRAYELFEAREREHGHDWEDWFRAESEVLRPVSLALSEDERQIRIRVSVLGFGHNELRIGIESTRVTVFGKKSLGAIETEGGKVEHIDWGPQQILQFIDLPSSIDPPKTLIELCSGVLRIELTKVSRPAVLTAA